MQANGRIPIIFLSMRYILIVEDPTGTVKCRPSVKALFLYFNLCLNHNFGQSLIVIPIHILSYKNV